MIISNSRLFHSKLGIAIRVNTAIILKTAFLYRTPLVSASKLKSNISNANLDKNKKKLFLYLDTSHPKQTNILIKHRHLCRKNVYPKVSFARAIYHMCKHVRLCVRLYASPEKACVMENIFFAWHYFQKNACVKLA